MALFALGVLAVFSADAAPKNLITNAKLKLDERGRLTGWEYPRKGAAVLNNDNTIGLKQGYQGYAAYWVTRVQVKPFTSYKLEFEIKAENLGKMAGVFYGWVDAEGKRLGRSERFAYKVQPGSTDGWVKVSRILNQEDPAKTARLNLCFAIYNAPGDGKVFYRNISLTAVGGDDDEEDAPAAKPAVPAANQAKNLIPNAELKLNERGSLTGWEYPRKGAAVLNNDNTIGLKQGYQGYAAYWVTRVQVKPFTSYKLEFEVKAENLGKMAGVFYTWNDAAGKRLGRSERFAYKAAPGSTDGWVKVSQILNQEDPAKTAKLNICFAIYNAPGDGKVFYRNISLTAIGGDDDDEEDAPAVPEKKKVTEKRPAPNQVKNQVKSAAKAKVELDFSAYKLTCKNPGEPYFVEKGRVGFFNLFTRNAVTDTITLKLTAPKGFYAELYMVPRGKSHTEFIAPDANGNFVIRNTEWRAMGNALLFELRDNCPENFTVKAEFISSAGDVVYSLDIPIVTLAKQPKLTAYPKFKLNSWYGYPLARIVPYNSSKGQLPDKMLNDWHDAGFTGARGVTVGSWDLFAECSHVFPWRAAQDRNMPALKTVGGTDGVLLCPSALIAAGKDYFAKKLKASSAYPELIKGRPACIDYEPYCFGWVTVGCFCQNCREAFQKYAKLNKRPGKRTILTQYEKEWVQFRCQQRADLIKAMADGLHEAAPKSQFYFCSMPSAAVSEENEYAKLYGITPKLYEKFVDVFLPMNYVPTILFYQRLQQDALTLTKPVEPVLDNGWGGNFSGYYPARLAMQIVSTAFCNMRAAYIGTGLLRMDSEYHLATRSAMQSVLLLEKASLQGKLVKNPPLELQVSESGKNYFHAFTRQLPNKKYLLMLVNNSPETPIFVKIADKKKNLQFSTIQLSDPANNTALSPDGKSLSWNSEALTKGFELELAPLKYKFILISGDANNNLAADDVRTYTKKRLAQDNALRKIAAAKRGNGMSFEVKNGKVYLTTLQGKLAVDLSSGGSALWSINNQNIATLGADCLVEPVYTNLAETAVKIFDSSLENDQVSVTVSSTLNVAAYKGLEIRKTYTMFKNSSQIRVDVAVIPTQGYRPFRYKFVNLMKFVPASKVASYGSLHGYKLPDGSAVKVDENPRHMAYCRPGRILSEGFRNYVPNPGTFSGEWCEAFERANPANKLKATFKDVDEVIFWRGGKDATLELVCFDAYPDRDPHKARTWFGSYTLEYKPNK